VALALGLSGSFAKLAVVSALARLVTYTGTCASTLRLRSPRFDPGGHGPRVNPATFVIPLGPTVPVIAILVSAAVVAGATREQLFGGGAALAVGALLYAAQAFRRSQV
jgi:basic amino acid/polyamine antiporter, APA family